MTENGPRLVPRPDGRGALLSGGTPGHKGGGGRPPSVVREIAREAYADRIPRLLAIIDSDESKPGEVVAAMALLERTGLGMRHELEVEQRPAVDVDALRARIEAMLPRVDNDEPSRTLPLPTGE